MEESELIRKSLEGDAEAFEALLMPHRGIVLQHCMQVVGNEAAAEDVMQEACVKAFRGLASFRQQAAFGTWLWRIAHNLCLNYLRQKKEGLPLDEGQVQAKEGDSCLMQECLECLPEKQRGVFEMFYVERLSQKEIAERLGVPCGTVRSRLYYAKKRLRGVLT